MIDRVGFMQGRLSPIVNGRIQAFPEAHWEQEYPLAARHGFRFMEWTLDQEKLHENPLLTRAGQRRIRELGATHGIAVASLTGDCFMQAPFWKAQGAERAALQDDFRAIAEACREVGIGIIVVPLVDNGSLANAAEEDVLVEFLTAHAGFLRERGLRVVFECDFPPAELARFIARLEAPTFGINYDMGNSAALGYDPAEEFAAYGQRVLNVHVKDRVLGGTTVALGTGAVNFDHVYTALGAVGYRGNYVLQTARARDDDHAGVLVKYRDMAAGWAAAHGA
jgi:hexulose-6-phosphate isomerase